MLVVTTAGTEKARPKVIVTMAAAEIDALLAGGHEHFPVVIGDRSRDVEMIAKSGAPAKGSKPHFRLRVDDGALQGARVGTVTVFFPDVPFDLVLMCSDPAPAGAVKISPRARASLAPEKSTLRERVLIGLGVAAFFFVVGYFREDSLYYLAGVGSFFWSVFDVSQRMRKR